MASVCLSCPCMSLQESVKVLAIIDAVLSIFNLILYTLALVGAAAYTMEQTVDDKAAQGFAIFLVVLYLFGSIIQILIAFKLYSGGKNANYQSCKFWMKITYVLLIIQIVGIITDFSDGEFKGYMAGGSLIDLIYKIYEMLVVSYYLNELNERHELVGKMEKGEVHSTPGQTQSQLQPFYPPQHPYAPTTIGIGPNNQGQFVNPMANNIL
ncbi:hypothetical protein Ocin01_17910 [Orchesella cincta]|uniref:Uncharacterized protein n=1 Tax=Orchesella cincta TaxID=48709 RepID=A0A1D2M771_ORCCI|nr:hypothetical protein Ocin01_17910 [Orchesella cincta]